ncbi:Dnaj homolog subfamily b member 14 [Phtheirospermum japonicum]|uniref:Dnaj homolog subfamily b member 14 n=1 Tax=Phtheirospermum japonicum TaxID=374723 RepID=A0A830BX21_9LAMI|nr:Dnaj homolog subfamily b member 14 [Phtheirospermum japonicum]
MECNKDEALRAKSIAESKLEQKDFAGSKKFALKAQTLYPGLDGISQMLTTLDVYISAEKKISGQINWYGVLGVGPSADDDMIKKQYRKLALMLHPDKNNSVGAEGAFKLISEAWSLLSDKAKRSTYNQTTGFNSKGLQHKPPANTTGPGPSVTRTAVPGTTAHTGGPSLCTVPQPGPSTESPRSKFAKRKTPAPKSQKKKAKPAKPAPPPPPPVQTVESFWTICGQCGIRYEYHKMYRNLMLLCPTCKTPFLAAEIPRPISKSRPHKLNRKPPGAQQQQQNPSENVRAPPPANNRPGPNIVPDALKLGTGQQPGPNIFTNPACQQAPTPAKVPDFEDKSKRAVCTESNASSGPDGYSKKREMDDCRTYGKNYEMTDGNVNFETSSTFSTVLES